MPGRFRLLRLMVLPLLLVAIGVLGGVARANDVYISQAGGGAGISCSSTLAISYFNTSGSWTSGTPTGTQIGPGTTVHLCGTFIGTAGTNELTTQGNGASGNPVSIVFESGAIMEAPYWGTNDGTNPSGGAIKVENGYVTVDGRNAGVIENTLNGDSGYAGCIGGTCTDQAISSGVYVGDVSNVTVENLTISSIYMKQPCGTREGSGNDNTGAVWIEQDNSGAMGNITVSNITASDDSVNITVLPKYSASVSNITLSNNTLSRAAINIVAAAGAGTTISNLVIDGNNMFDDYVWWDPSDVDHLNAAHIFTSGASSQITGLQMYNNYVHGDFGGQTCGGGGSHTTTFLYVDPVTSGSPINNADLFNNVLIEGTNDAPSNGAISLGEATGINTYLYDNTIVGYSSGAGIGILTPGTVTVYNNVFSTLSVGLYLDTSTSQVTASDHNDFYNVTSAANVGGTTLYNFSSWQGLGFDAHSVTGNPDLNSNYQPQSGSAAIGLGTNLYSTCSSKPNTGLGALCYDKLGNARPLSSPPNWDAGAYYNSSGTIPAPPTALLAIPH